MEVYVKRQVYTKESEVGLIPRRSIHRSTRPIHLCETHSFRLYADSFRLRPTLFKKKFLENVETYALSVSSLWFSLNTGVH